MTNQTIQPRQDDTEYQIEIQQPVMQVYDNVMKNGWHGVSSTEVHQDIQQKNESL